MTTDCTQYIGRKRQICEGKEADGSPIKMSEWKREAYLARWNGREPVINPAMLMHNRGPGTELEKLLKERGYAVTKSCSCRSRIGKMNHWGADGCRKNIEEIVGWLIESATASGGITAAVIRVPGLSAIARHEIRKLVTIAIDRSAESES
jgi:hypothetical protein